MLEYVRVYIAHITMYWITKQFVWRRPKVLVSLLVYTAPHFILQAHNPLPAIPKTKSSENRKFWTCMYLTIYWIISLEIKSTWGYTVYIYPTISFTRRHEVAQLVEALRYKLKGRGFDSRLSHNLSGCSVTLGLTQPLTEMSTRNISWG